MSTRYDYFAIGWNGEFYDDGATIIYDMKTGRPLIEVERVKAKRMPAGLIIYRDVELEPVEERI